MSSLKTAKGTRDYCGEWLQLRTSVIEHVRQCCLAHDAEELDTPLLELSELLGNKYGEDQKLIYNLEDFEGERLSLRYDLTVPFARYLAANRMTGGMRRFQVGKVYRRDNPKMTRGRFREFYQCDFDIAGANCSPMVWDAEVIFLTARVLDTLKLPNYTIKLNHRSLLEGVLLACGVSSAAIKTVCSSIDKLDKKPWSEVRDELIVQKCVASDVVEQIGSYVVNGTSLDSIRSQFPSSKLVQTGVKDIRLLMERLASSSFSIDDQRVKFDCTLARGLDYYTGIIYEAVVVEENSCEGGSIGTVAAGGRYDKLVAKIAKSGNSPGSGIDIPCVGVSFGIERIVTILEERLRQLSTSSQKFPYRSLSTEVYVASAQSGFLNARLALVQKLIDAGFNVGYSGKEKAKFLDQIQYCENQAIPFCILIGQSEVDSGAVKLRNVQSRDERLIANDALIDELKTLIKQYGEKRDTFFVEHGLPPPIASNNKKK